MNCPRCNVSLSITDRQGIEIDFCAQCRGIWLDRGELDKIVERASRFNDDDDDDDRRERQMRPGEYGRGDREHYYKKRKSFWSELFD